MLLKGMENIWWRNQVEDIFVWKYVLYIVNWVEIKTTLQTQFGLGNQTWITRKELMELKHTGSIKLST